MEAWKRTEMLIGKEAVERLGRASVIVFGAGGVGGGVIEALARGGIGKIDVVDNDAVSVSNLNRQILATVGTVGKSKALVAKERILSINPQAEVNAYELFYTDGTAEIDFSAYDYIVDAIDSVRSKLSLVKRAQEAGVPIISCMGTGNKIDPSAFEIADIYKTSVCPLARVMRSELRKMGISHLKVLYSREEPKKPTRSEDGELVPASISFVPPVAGMMIAGEVIRDLIR